MAESNDYREAMQDMKGYMDAELASRRDQERATLRSNPPARYQRYP